MIELYTDGGARPTNPGPGGWAAAWTNEDQMDIVVSGGAATTTNNRMELVAVIQGLDSVLGVEGPSEVKVVSDSTYVVSGWNLYIRQWVRRGWKTGRGKPVLNVELWQALQEAVAAHKSVEFVHVKGHSGVRLNDLCDERATLEAMRFGGG